MRLIKKSIQDKSWWKGFAKKASAVAVASTITFGSLFGLSGCGNKNDVNVDENNSSVSDTQKETEALKDIVNSLSVIVSQLNASDEVKSQLSAIEQKLADIESGKTSQDEVVANLTALVAELQQEVKSIKERLDAIENKEESKDEEENVETISDELAKVNAKLAITNAFDNNHMLISYEGVDMITSPDGDLVASRGMYDDYAYYDTEQKVFYQSVDGEQAFVHVTNNEQIEHLDYKSLCLNSLSDDTFVLDEAQSNANKYVFKAEDGSSITIQIELGEFVSFGNDYVQISKSTQEKFEQLLAECKSHLKMIGLYESFTKELDSSLNYKYKGLTGSSSETGNATGVFSGRLAAAEMDKGENILYSTQTEDRQYDCEIDKNGEFVEDWEYDGEPYDMTEAFKFSFTQYMIDGYNTISKDVISETYKMTNFSSSTEKVIEVKFNDDLSVDTKITYKYNKEGVKDETITYHIEKISKEKFDEVYNRILAIVENAKENQADVTV